MRINPPKENWKTNAPVILAGPTSKGNDQLWGAFFYLLAWSYKVTRRNLSFGEALSTVGSSKVTCELQ